MIRSEQDLLDEIERSTNSINRNARLLDREANEQMGLLTNLQSEMQVKQRMLYAASLVAHHFK